MRPLFRSAPCAPARASANGLDIMQTSRKLAFIMFLIMSAAAFAAVSGDSGDAYASADDALFNGGDGSEENPYQIATAEQLMNMSQVYSKDCHFILVCDIALSGNSVPIGSSFGNAFSGVFDGGYRSITNFKCTEEEAGLFYDIASNAVVKNLHVQVDIDGRTCAGGIAVSNHGTIQNCTVGGDVTVSGGHDMCVGGIAGHNSGAIDRCTNEAYVHSTASEKVYIGGIAGLDDGGRYTDCFNTGKVELKEGSGASHDFFSSSIGSLIGMSNGDMTAEYFINDGKINAIVSDMVGISAFGTLGSSCTLKGVYNCADVTVSNPDVTWESEPVSEPYIVDSADEPSCTFTNVKEKMSMYDIDSGTALSGWDKVWVRDGGVHLTKPIEIEHIDIDAYSVRVHNHVNETVVLGVVLLFDDHHEESVLTGANKVNPVSSTLTVKFTGIPERSYTCPSSSVLEPTGLKTVRAPVQNVFVIGKPISLDGAVFDLTYNDGKEFAASNSDLQAKNGSAYSGKQSVTVSCTFDEKLRTQFYGYFHDDGTYGILIYASGDSEPEFTQCSKGGSVTIPTPSADDGWKFSGWYTAPDGGDRLSVGDDGTFTPTGDVTMYAHMEKEQSPMFYVFVVIGAAVLLIAAIIVNKRRH